MPSDPEGVKVTPIPPRTPDMPMKVYNGGCHCGKFAFSCRHPVLEDGFEVVSCNCSIFFMDRGYLVIYILNAEEDFKLTRGAQAELRSYKFNKQFLTHRFCPICGSGLLAEAIGAKRMIVGVNVRTIANLGVELENLTLKKISGRAL